MTTSRSISPTADRVQIRGGNPLRGTVVVRGAKNSLPKCMVAAILTDKMCTLQNVADIQDVELVADMIRAMGGEVTRLDDGGLQIVAHGITPLAGAELREFSGKSRIPILFCGPLLARCGEAFVPGLGGCQIGPRPIDFHLEVLKQFGAVVVETDEGLRLSTKQLTGCKIRLAYPSVGATEQAILTAVLARGVTEISMAAVEPEIIDLVALLQKMGANISVSTDRVITVVGVDVLRGYHHTAMPDRLEVASWACAAVATGGRIKVLNARQLDMITFLNKFRLLGGEFDVEEDGIVFWRRYSGMRSVALETDVHPGFMTDWQQPFVIALTQAQGVSIVHETVYENRFGYVSALNRMGAQIQLYQECLGSKNCRFGQRNLNHSAVVVGPTALRAADIKVPDLRAGFTYVIAALVADGISTVENVRIIRRGYELFFDRLVALGAEVLEA